MQITRFGHATNRAIKIGIPVDQYILWRLEWLKRAAMTAHKRKQFNVRNALLSAHDDAVLKMWKMA